MKRKVMMTLVLFLAMGGNAQVFAEGPSTYAQTFACEDTENGFDAALLVDREKWTEFIQKIFDGTGEEWNSFDYGLIVINKSNMQSVISASNDVRYLVKIDPATEVLNVRIQAVYEGNFTVLEVEGQTSPLGGGELNGRHKDVPPGRPIKCTGTPWF